VASGDGWEWATDPRFPLWCLTFTKDLAPAEVLRRYATCGEGGRAAHGLVAAARAVRGHRRHPTEPPLTRTPAQGGAVTIETGRGRL
jgi:hypothetical protein